MASPSIIFRLTLTLILLLSCGQALGQKFRVESFKTLANDVTAFVQPVNDLNDEACALIKVQASPEFEFSTPLGIVKREDKTGEIWLYIPKGSKKITLKHPEWGIVRDYEFPSKIESHMAYELRVAEPALEPAVTLVHDTLVVTRTDTMLIAAPKKRIPLSLLAIASVSYGGQSKTLAGGLMLALMKRNGGFAHVSTDFGHLGQTAGSCDRLGYVDGRLPYYSGKTRHSFLMATAGAIHRLSAKVRIFEGVGYGYDNAAWQLAPSEGSAWLKNTHYCHSGVAFEVGAVVTVKKVAISASVMSIKGKQWYGSIGIGINLSKSRRHE